MNADSYHRTLEYVQRCTKWSGSEPAPGGEAAAAAAAAGGAAGGAAAGPYSVAASDVSVMDSASNVVPRHGNMVINDMNSAMTALARENRYLHM